MHNPPIHKDKFKSKAITVLLSDLRGFTAMSETIPPSDVMNMLNRYFYKMSDIIVHQYGGTIDKFMGDSIMALFGIHNKQPDDLKRALACAISMQIAMDEVNQENKDMGLPELYMGIGINTGNVVAGELGSEIYSQYTVIGDEVNLTHRIESFTLRGQILISGNSYNQASSFIDTGAKNEVYSKGKHKAITLYELLAVNLNSTIKLITPRREMRKSHRIEINQLFIYHHVDGKQINPTRNQGTIIDISYGGMFASIAEDIPLFSEIKFDISLSFVDGVNDSVYAKVLRIAPAQDRYLVNFEFTALSPKAQKALKTYIDTTIELS
jgi:adenylate cyclase